MDCHEAKRRLNSTKVFSDKELREHLKNCSECADKADAGRLLNKAFLAMGEEYKNETTPLHIIRSRVTEELKNNRLKESGFMTQIKNAVSRRPKLAVGFTLAVAVFLLITLVPFSYDRIVGYEVAFSNVGHLENEQLQKIDAELSALGLNDISIEISNSNINISHLPNRVAAEKVAILVSSMIGKTISSQIKIVTETVSGSLYAQVVEKNRTIEIKAKGKSSEEIREEIKQKLIAEGFADPEVTVTTTADGAAEIYVKISDHENDMATEGVIELKISGDTDSFEIPVLEEVSGELDIDMEGKTDAEIKTAIEEKLASEGKEGAVVRVITGPDGKKEITVDFEEKIIK